MRAFILAGGFATRLWPLTEKRAKPLLPLAGKPLISYIVEGLPRSIPVTVSTNAIFAHGFTEWRATIDHESIDIVIEQSKRDDQKLGALGALAQWVDQSHINEDILLLTGDNYFGFDLQSFIEAARKDTALLAAHDIGDLDRARSFGTVLLNEDRQTIRAFQEKPRSPESTLVSTGCSLLPASLLPVLQEYATHHPDNVGGIFEELLKRGKTIDCFISDALWFDIGSFEAYLAATRALIGHRTIDEGDIRCDRTRCNGSVVLGKGSSVTNSTLTDTVLFDRCSVEDCVLTDCVIDADCVLKGIDLTGKMLRAGTRLTRK
ncbi:MAG: NDP-sugar synthase [Candidatus Peribacteraceae bacterium]|nr:NDP-sugar synthase [Candidatus Peribacteraceae bacterium]